mmetsp:Transcript_2590/g.5672  ORF Transcript_2590/g.5672 Transcript_2590/m.5672 type:complete len:766 (-) Transcript_2590:236-2533(-)
MYTHLQVGLVLLCAVTTSERVCFKMLVDRVVPFRYLLLVLVVAVETICLGAILQVRACVGGGLAGRSSSEPFPRHKLLVMAALDLSKDAMMILSGAFVAPTLTVILLQGQIPCSMLLSLAYRHQNAAPPSSSHAHSAGGSGGGGLVSLVASDGAGLLYGSQTLAQLVDAYAQPSPPTRPATRPSPEKGTFLGLEIPGDDAGSGGWCELPALWIEDWADLGTRAAVVDARAPQTPKANHLLALVRRLAVWRYTTLHLVVDSADSVDLEAVRKLANHFFINLVPAWAPTFDPAPGTLAADMPALLQGLAEAAPGGEISLLLDHPPDSPTDDPPEEPSPGWVKRCVECASAAGFESVNLWGLKGRALSAGDLAQLMPTVVAVVREASEGFGALPVKRVVQGGVVGSSGLALRSSPLVQSMVHAARVGERAGATAYVVQSLPWKNPMYPLVCRDLALFVGAGVTWNLRAASEALANGPGLDRPAAGPANLKGEGQVRGLVRRHVLGALGGVTSVGTLKKPPGFSKDRDDRAEVDALADLLGWEEKSGLTAMTQEKSGPGQLAESGLDGMLWKFHTVNSCLPDALFASEGEALKAGALGGASEMYKTFSAALRNQKATRQKGLGWVHREEYSEALNGASGAMRHLDSMHLAMDLLKQSCRLLQLLLTMPAQAMPQASAAAAEAPSTGEEGAQEAVAALIRRIPAATRTDLANKLLDLYQRFAVLWVRAFEPAGLPAAFRQPLKLLEQLTFDLPHFRVDQISERVFTAQGV